MAGGARRNARVQVSTRLTWTLSARAVLGRVPRTRTRRGAPALTVRLPVSTALVRSVLAGMRSRPSLPRGPRGRRTRPR
ncbi:hypothetical protein ACFV2Z_29015 [Streptomyces sp. NPDC059688]|uniref:hypothetical protein n=1 Tax=unclassified Streptomyces TaxID=2593676 RepID=UPI000A71FD2F|nr:hypothetical protein [Streptomyces sp. CB01883]